MKILIITTLALSLFSTTGIAREYENYQGRDSDSYYHRDRENLRRFTGMELDYGRRQEKYKIEKRTKSIERSLRKMERRGR